MKFLTLSIILVLCCLCSIVTAEEKPLYISKAKFYDSVYIPDNIKALCAKNLKNLSPEELQRLKKKPEYDISTSEYIDGVYIPEDLQEAWIELDKSLSDEDHQGLKKIQEYEMANFHFSSGIGIRNSWGLWSGSRLAKYFNEIGIHHPDDMSAIILDTFWCRINDKPLKLEQRITFYKQYWKVRLPPERKTYPEQKLRNIGSSFYNTAQGRNSGCIQIFKNADSGKIWLYENGKGWKVAKKSFYKKYPSWKYLIKTTP